MQSLDLAKLLERHVLILQYTFIDMAGAVQVDFSGPKRLILSNQLG